jgi:Trk K+ transport system NAD-binding subunit
LNRPLRSRHRLLLLLVAVPALLLATAFLYMLGMSRLEGHPRGFWDSLEWAAESLTTTGYGADSHWSHPLMVLFVVAVQFAGVFLVFLLVPIYLIPFLEERFEARLPLEVEGDLAGHVVIYRFGPAVESLLGELAGARVPSLVLEPDEATARRLFEQEQRGVPVVPVVQQVIHRGLDDGALQAARLDRARALIANGSDDENAAFILSARQLGFGGPILALVEEPNHRRPIELAGATATFTPRHMLGAALAARASHRISPRVAGAQSLGRNLEVAEMQVRRASPLAGKTLEEAEIGPRTGAIVVGQWRGGELQVMAGADARLEPGSLLVVVGSHESIERLSELVEGAQGESTRRHGHFVVCGGGEVGRKVSELLRIVGESVRLIDRRPGPEVDQVGDVLDLRILEAADVRNAQAVILALDTDSATLFASVILKDLAPEVPVIARVNHSDNVERIHRAGAYFALSISQVSGQMLAKKLLGQEAVAVDPQLKILKVAAGGLAGQHPAALRVRERTGCSVVAVERGEDILVDLGPAFRFAPDDALYVCGSTGAVRRFSEVFGEVLGREAGSG